MVPGSGVPCPCRNKEFDRAVRAHRDVVHGGGVTGVIRGVRVRLQVKTTCLNNYSGERHFRGSQ